MNSQGLIRFGTYALIGVSTFIFDLLLLWVLTQYIGIFYTYASAGSFFVAVSINYYISKHFVFFECARPVTETYSKFLGIAIVGSLFTAGGMYALVTYFGVHYMIARVSVAGFVGVCNYLANTYLNFTAVRGK